MSRLTHIVRQFINECWHAHYDPQCLYESLSETCLHKKTIGRCYGIDTFQSDCDDWGNAFPDYSTQILKIEEFNNLVIVDVLRFGTHQHKYQSTNSKKDTALKPSHFLSVIEEIQPTKASYRLPAKLIFTFEKERITQVIIDEDPMGMHIALGLPQKPDGNQRETINYIDFATVREKVAFYCSSPLTKREIQVVALTFCGLTAKHVAEKLHLSHRTIETFLQTAYAKFRINGKQDLIEYMYEKYLLAFWIDLGKQLLQVGDDLSKQQ